MASGYADVTAKVRIRHAALELIASRGYTGASLRMISHRASVTPGLIGHHFGTKAGLRDAVVVAVVNELYRAAILSIEGYRGSGGIGPFVTAMAHVLRQQPILSNFIRRSFCEVPPDEVSTVHEALRSMIERLLLEMEQHRLVGTAANRSWRATQVMMLLFGTLVLAPPRRPDDVEEALAENSRAKVNADIFLLEHGIAGSIGDPQRVRPP